MGKLTGIQKRATETVKCKVCGVELHYDGYLEYEPETLKLKEFYFYCSEHKK